MESRFELLETQSPSLPEGFELIAWSKSLARDHATAKFASFRNEIDANVFPCLARKASCLQLMSDLVDRKDFVAEATWLAVYREKEGVRWEAVGTIQGLRSDLHSGAIQNIGIVPQFRGLGLGAALVYRALQGFAQAGCRTATLEVTSKNTAAIRLYERLGFRTIETVYKIADVLVA